MSRFYDGDELEDRLIEAAGRGLFTPESELALVSAMLCQPSSCEDVVDRIVPELFANSILGRVWGEARSAMLSGRHVSAALIADAIGTDPAFEEWGGANKLLDLTETGSTAGVAEHAEAVADRAGRRAIKALLDRVTPALMDTSKGDHTLVLGIMEAGAAEIAKNGHSADRFIPAGALVGNAVRAAQSRSGVIEFPTGIKDVDAKLGGFNRGEMSLLGARTGMGKTIAGLQSAKASAQAGYGTCFFSLEMSDLGMGLRLACDIAFDRNATIFGGLTSNPTMDGAAKNNLDASQWQRLAEAEAVADKLPLHFDVRPGLTMAQIEAATRRKHRQWERQGIKPGPVFIDHMGKVRPSKDRKGNATAELSDVSNDCAEMAKRLNVPVVPMVQLNRQVEGRGDDKRPQLSDMRQSGQLEEDARQVIFLYRPEYYLREPLGDESFEERTERQAKLDKVKNQLFWLIEKNSNGPRTQVKTFCEVACSVVRNWDPV